MPKEQRAPSTHRQSPFPTTQARQSKPVDAQPGQRNTVNWSSADDEVLVAARAAGLNWQSTAEKHFPNKTANACRKRHERLVERQTQDDWSTQRLSTLAIEYMEFRKEIWTIIAARTGERWSVVEAKCMEKGLKNLQSIARAASRASASCEDIPTPGNKEEDEGDSGIGYSDAELEPVDEVSWPVQAATGSVASQVPLDLVANEQSAENDVVPRLPPLPLYRPPSAAPVRTVSSVRRNTLSDSYSDDAIEREHRLDSPRRSVSIQSLLT